MPSAAASRRTARIRFARIEAQGADLGRRIDAMSGRIDAVSTRIDGLSARD